MKQLMAQQYKNLERIAKLNNKSSLFVHLGLAGLDKYRRFELLYQSFVRGAPMHTYNSWLKTLRIMARDGTARAESLIQRQNMVTSQKPVGYSYIRRRAVPVTKSIVKDYFAFETALIKSLRQGGASRAKGVFMMNEFIPGQQEPLITFEELIFRQRSFLQRNGTIQSAEDFVDHGRSRHQWMYAFYQQLKKMGHKVDVLMAPPRFLADFSLFLAQQEGQFTKLKDLCPKLDVYVATAELLDPYRVELSYLLQDLPKLSWVQANYSASGVMSWQSDPNINSRMSLLETSQVFYEFVPATDLDDGGRLYRNYKRYTVDSVEEGKEYLLMYTNDAGLVSFNSGWVIKVVSLVPFQFVWQRSQHVLNTFGEGLAANEICHLVHRLNETLGAHGLFIRDFMVSGNTQRRQHEWILELSRPIQDMDRNTLNLLAKRLHTDLEMNYEAYRKSFLQGLFQKPEISFVSMGTFGALPDNLVFRHVDDTPDSSRIQAVKQAAGQQIATIQSHELG